MARRDDGMIDVELVGDPVTDESPDREPADSPRPVSGPRRHGLRALAAVIAAALLALTAGQAAGEAAADRRDEDLLARFRDVPGIAPSLREPPTELWRPPVGAAVAGDLVVAHEPVDGVRRTVGRDARTGAALWVAPSALDPTDAGVACQPTADVNPVVLCWVPGGGGMTAQNTDLVVGRRPERLVALDTADGRIRQDRVIDSRTIGWAVLGEDLVLALRDDDTVLVERTPLAGGDPLWSTRVDLPTRVLARDMGVRVSDGLVTVTGPAAAVLDGVDGSVLATASVPPGAGSPVQVTTSPTGFVLWATADEGVWYDRTGAAGARLPGGRMRVPIDDGAMPDVVLLDDETAVQAVDVRDGEVLWRRERVDGVLLRLGGVVMVEDKERLRVLDLSTGRERWSVRRGLGAATPGTRPVTDGVRVLVPGYDIDAGRRVTAYDLREGTRDWSVTLPPRVSALSVSGGVLVGTGDQMVVLGSAP